MSFDRVLPNPAVLRYEAPQVSLPRTTNLLDHKIMNDGPMANGTVGHRPDPADACRYAELRPNGRSQPTQLPFGRPKGLGGKPEPLPIPNGMNRPPGPMLDTKDLVMRDRSPMPSSTASPMKSALEDNEQFCLCQPDPKIPRPRNAFILYRQHYQAMVVAHNPGLANPDISKIIGEQWRSLSEDEKNKWRALAEEEKARHNQQYPGYRYQPRRFGRDGSGSRNSALGLGHNPSGKTHCNRCGGRIMNAPSSPMTPFTPTPTMGAQPYRPSNLSAGPMTMTTMTARSSQARERNPKQPPKPIRIDQIDPRSRYRHADESSDVPSPEVKRRRVSQASHTPISGLGISRERSPDSAYPATPYSARPDMQPRNMLPALNSQRAFGGPQSQPPPHPDPSLKLAPLQTSTPVMTPTSAFSQDGSSVEATVMTIPFLNKIKLLAKISPPLAPSFRETNHPIRGPVVSVDGQDSELVQMAVDYLEGLLKKESKYNVRIFDGPNVQAPRRGSGASEAGYTGDVTVDYIDTISAWHRISDEVKGFVRSSSAANSVKSRASPDEEAAGDMSPKTIIPKTATLQINSPAQSSENGSEGSVVSSGSHTTLPIALVPRYQLTTADTFACSIPINDSYTALDHWQWMASLWRACVGPDITVYIRECTRDELERAGGNPVEVRLQDARTIVLRKVAGTPRELEEKSLRRVGFEIEDFLTQ